MKIYKIICIPVVLACTMLLCNGQTIYYGYDVSGNRTSRSITLQKSTTQEDIEEQPEQKEIKDQVGNKDIQIYPNPVNYELTVKIPELAEGDNASISLFGQGGQLLYRNDKAKAINRVSFSEFTPGIYYMIIEIGENNVEWKVVKE
jgi:hypothetical protein